MILQQLINGLMLGSVYTLIAIAYALIMGILGVLNIAVAEVFMIGAFLGMSALLAGIPVWLAILAAMAGGVVVSVLVERLGCRPLRNAPVIMPLLSTLGFSLVLQTAAVNLWGSDPLQLPPSLFSGRVRAGPISIGTSQLLIAGTAVALVLLLGWTVRKTWFGRSLRAVAENSEAARIMGVSTERVTTVTFALSGVLAGAAGFLVGLHYSAVTPYVGHDTGLKGIAVMVVGGVNNVWGALLAGPLIGVAEVMAVAYGGASYRDVVVYGLLIVVLLIKPEGLFTASGLRSARRRV